MHYLKCNHCGNLNEIKTKYLVFCSSCNKKIENNFPNWEKANPEKTLDDFKQLVCISEEQIQKINSIAKPKKPKKSKYFIGFGIAFVIIAVIIYGTMKFDGQAIIKYLLSDKTSKEIFNQKWVKETYGDNGLTIETPEKLTKGNLPLPDEAKKMIDQIDLYSSLSAKGFKILINSIRYKPEVGSVNLQGAANGTVTEMKNGNGVTDFDYTEISTSNNGIPGILQNITFKKDGIDVEFTNILFGTGINLWQVSVGYQADDEVGRIAAKRVIESIEIKRKQ